MSSLRKKEVDSKSGSPFLGTDSVRFRLLVSTGDGSWWWGTVVGDRPSLR